MWELYETIHTLRILPYCLLDVLLHGESGVHLIKSLLWPLGVFTRLGSWQVSSDDCVVAILVLVLCDHGSALQLNT